MLTIAWWTVVAVLTLVGRLVFALSTRTTERADSIAGRTLAELLQRLGPAFIKVGQLLSSRHDLLTPDAISRLRGLQDRMPPMRATVARRLVCRELGAPLDKHFAEFGDVPIASGSIASVYRARLHDGRVVAVKVRRPGVEASIAADLRLFRRLAHVAQRWRVCCDLPLVAVIDDVGTCLMEQVDFRREARANRRFQIALSSSAGVVIPALVDELCTSAVLTMEFVEAFVEPIVRRTAADKAAIRVALRALFQMIFVEGLVHCDMHEGNLRLLGDGRVALIDFGFVAPMPTEARLSFAEFFFAMATGDGAWCADISLQLAAGYPENLDRATFTREISAVVSQAAGQSVGEYSVGNFVAKLFDIQRRHRVRSTPAFMMAIVGLLTVEGLAGEIDAELDFQREAMPFVAAAGIWGTGTRAGNPESTKRMFRRHKLRGEAVRGAGAERHLSAT